MNALGDRDVVAWVLAPERRGGPPLFVCLDDTLRLRQPRGKDPHELPEKKAIASSTPRVGARPGLAWHSIAAMLQRMKSHLVSVQSRGTIALPPDLRRRMHLDQPDAQVRLIEREDGRVELVPVVAIPADQAWFWTDRWQAMEREADADIAAGRVTAVDGVEELLSILDSEPPEQ